MLTPAEESFRGNKVAVIVVTLLWLYAGVWAYVVLRDPGSRSLASGLTFLAILVALTALWAWLFSLRVSLHPDGISKQTWLGCGEMRWNDVESFHYGAERWSLNLIPIGTYYSFKLVSLGGGRMRLGSWVERPAELGQKLITSTFAPLYPKVAQLFNSGAELDFGPVKLSRDGGLRVQRLFRSKQIPLDQLSGYRMHAGSLYIFRAGEKRAASRARIREIPNPFVLVGLLDAICRPEPPRSRQAGEA
jgi:Family of unknown function (DUF6585)